MRIQHIWNTWTHKELGFVWLSFKISDAHHIFDEKYLSITPMPQYVRFFFLICESNIILSNMHYVFIGSSLIKWNIKMNQQSTYQFIKHSNKLLILETFDMFVKLNSNKNLVGISKLWQDIMRESLKENYNIGLTYVWW